MFECVCLLSQRNVTWRWMGCRDEGKQKSWAGGGGGEGKDGGKSSTSSVGVDLALRWLRKLHVLLARHEPSQLQQHHPDTVGVLPLGQRSHRMHVNLQDRTSKDGCDVTP